MSYEGRVTGTFSLSWMYSVVISGSYHCPQSRDIARELKKIYERDGPPDHPQSDQGLEFHGRVENICKKYKI